VILSKILSITRSSFETFILFCGTEVHDLCMVCLHKLACFQEFSPKLLLK
jgi:hypothetical protein